MAERVATRNTSATATHDRMVAENVAQRERLAGPRDDDWAALAQAFHADPRRKRDSLLEQIASYVQPEDVVLDVGGGAGRLSLPLALRSKEVIIVDPSDGMRGVFDKTANDAGISNARYVTADWLEAEGIEGDVALVAHVTYFVSTIEPFITKLNQSTRRRVVVVVRSVPPPNQIAPFFALAHRDQLAPVPGHEELLAVLEELGIAAELIDVGPATVSATAQIQSTRPDTIKSELEAAQRMGWLGKVVPETLAELIEEHFDDLFVETEKGFVRKNIVDARDLLITWETR
jgi:2-polyprenyl-3-methyl-5-hydroxy-6-metoxy-1,4-benzoquinol methylase